MWRQILRKQVTVHDSAIKYLDAAQFCRRTLGDEIAGKYFDRLHTLARRNSPAELRSIILGWKVEETNADALKVGAAFRLPPHIPRQFLDDATQATWVKVLETPGVPDDKTVNVSAQTAARKIVRQERKYVPFPEIEHDDGTTEPFVPSDGDDEGRVWDRVAAEIRRSKQEQLLRELSPEDFWFLMRYLTSRRKRRASRADRDRASAIREKLRRHFKKAVGDDWQPV